MAEERKSRAQEIQQARKQTEIERSQTKNTTKGISFLNAKHALRTARIK